MPRTLLLVVALCATTATAQPFLIPAGVESGLPLVEANDNRTPSGSMANGVLELDLELVEADFRPETDEHPGVRVLAVQEVGGVPQIPAPLIRVETGTRIRARFTNTLTDSTVSVFGLHTRPIEYLDSLAVFPGETGTVEFEAGEPGTYLYRVRIGNLQRGGFGRESEQLTGAFVVDPPGGSPPDRVMVMNIWSRTVPQDDGDAQFLETLTINGKSWPHTERLRPEVGETQRWRVVNGSRRNHPMHLHGFYFEVTDRANMLASDDYSDADHRTVVTEFMRGLTTMDMEWTPTRPGNWVFHCHLAFHISPEVRLPGSEDQDGHGHSPHMAGLVMGIEIPPGPTDIVERSEAAHLLLHAEEYANSDSTTRYAFSFDPESVPDRLEGSIPGPLILLRRYQPTFVTVRNNLSVPTGVHWHGLELDAWADGVPNWSASDGKMSPVIQPDSSFTYKLSSLRPGTFIYHSHLNDVDQLTRGLYGPMVVLDEADTFDPTTDHVNIVGWRRPNPQGPDDVEMNGLGAPGQPDVHLAVGETHRIRVINIAPAGAVRVQVTSGETPVPIVPVAKDGADLPQHQQVPIEVSERFGVGETADFAFTPTEPGTYTLHIGYNARFGWTQNWIASER